MPVLNIKDPVAYKLASELARQTGKSLTRVVVDALSNEAARSLTSRPVDRARVQALQQRYRATLQPGSTPVTDDDLYDNNGLPR